MIVSRSIALLALAGFLPPVFAVNRCVTPSGQVLYTDEVCTSIGAQHQREVKTGISVVPVPPAPPAIPATDKPKSAARSESKPAKKIFQKSPGSPLLTVCYDPKDARPEVTKGDVEAAISAAVSLWNAGCNVDYRFMGTCPNAGAAVQRNDQPIDYKVWWVSWDDTLTIANGAKTFREHAIAAASPKIGVSLNRTIEDFKFIRQYRRAIVHEFGHVLGIGHSPNPGDVMYTGGRNGTPTQSDLDNCNKAVEARFGVKSVGN